MKDYIKDLPKEGPVALFAVVTAKEQKEKKDGNLYLNVELSDKTGKLDAKVWDDVENLGPSIVIGEIIKVLGPMGEYRGKPQFTIKRARPAVHEEIDRSDFVRCSSRGVADMMAELDGFVAGLSGWTGQVVKSILSDPLVADKIRQAPAAMRIHHAFESGLLEHVCSLLGLARKVCDHYPKLSRDVLYAGVILHDLAKCLELEFGLSTKYSAQGQMLGHVAMGYALFEKHCQLITPVDEVARLKIGHLILSHHGQLEYGAAKVPACPEAVTMHFIDALDARLEQMFRLIEESDDEDFTSYDRVAGSIYRR